MINNAGVAHAELIKDKNVDKMAMVYNINMVSHLYTIKAILPSMLKRNHGHIVTMGSSSSFLRGVGLADYHATKKGVLG